MRVRIEAPKLLIEPGQDGVLTSEAPSKIAYEIANLKEAHEILFETGREVPELNSSSARVPLRQRPKETLYLLRSTLDALAVRNGATPLHGAYIERRKKGLLLLGGTECGKSTIALRMLSIGAKIYGDDHVVISNGRLFGNQMARIRHAEEDTYFRTADEIAALDNYSVAVLLRGPNKSESISCEELAFSHGSDILKYLIRPLGPDRVATKDVYGSEVIQRYRSSFESIVNKAQAVLRLRGSMDYVLSSLEERCL